MKVASQLEDSLTVAASALALVKSVEPNIITIQVAKKHDRVEEGEHDYSCSLCSASSTKRAWTTCCSRSCQWTSTRRCSPSRPISADNQTLVWRGRFLHYNHFSAKSYLWCSPPQTNTYKCNLVDLAPCARLFPQTNIDSCTMVHLWPKVRHPICIEGL